MFELPPPPNKPTVYFVGVQPLPQELLDVLPKWARRFGHRSTAIEPVAATSDPDDAGCRRFVDFMRDEYNAVGAVMVSHAAALFDHTQQMFDELDGDTELLGEISVAIRAPGSLTGLAPAKQAALQAYEHVFGDDSNPTEVLIIGASAPARALALALSNAADGAVARRVTLTTLDGKSMSDMRHRIADLPEEQRPELRHIESQLEHDRLVTLLPPGSLVVNATEAATKDAASPVGDAALFPQDGLVWDLDAVGISSPFLDKARQQRSARGLRLADGPAFHQIQWIAATVAVFGGEINPADIKRMRKQIG